MGINSDQYDSAVKKFEYQNTNCAVCCALSAHLSVKGRLVHYWKWCSVVFKIRSEHFGYYCGEIVDCDCWLCSTITSF
jgi:hypothetical protein